MVENIKHWIKLSDYDLKTASAMLDSKRYLYVGFMCHQTIEKILKAYYTSKIQENPPYVHNLQKLADLCNLYQELTDEQKNIIATLQPLNIEARYPKYKDAIFKSLNKRKCEVLLNNTKIFQQWVKKKLK
jgi:HEPN domain-containing protein